MSARNGTPRLEPHPIALRYPWSEEACASMVKNIERDGQREAIVLYEGKILDGRHRYEACMRLGRMPRTREFGSEESDGASPTRFAHSMNVERRHVDKSVLAMLAAESVREEDRAAAKARMAEGGKAASPGKPRKGPDGRQDLSDDSTRPRDREAVADAADAFGVSTRQVYRAQALIREAPEVAERVKAGELSVWSAIREVGIEAESKQEPKTEAPKPKPHREPPDPKGAPLHERSYLDPELRTRVMELLAEGRSQAEVASILEFGDAAYRSGAVGGFKKPSSTVATKVSKIRSEIQPAKAESPLAGKVKAVEAMAEDFKSWGNSLDDHPWSKATPAQVSDLCAHVDSMVSAARKFLSKVSKEVQS